MEQLNLFEALCTNAEAEDYLQRGQRILSLLKVREGEKKENKGKSSFFEAFNFTTYSSKIGYQRYDYVVKCVRNHLIRPMMDNLTESGEIVLPTVKKMFASCADTVHFDVIGKGTDEDKILSSFFFAKSKRGNYTHGVKLSFPDGGDCGMIPLGSKAKLTKKQHNALYRLAAKPGMAYVRVCDAGMLLAFPVLIAHLHEEIIRLIRIGRNSIQEKLADLQKQVINGLQCSPREEDKKQILYIHELASSYEFIMEYIRNNSIPYQIVSTEAYRTGLLGQGAKMALPRDFIYLCMMQEKIPSNYFSGFLKPPHEGLFRVYKDSILDIFNLAYEEYVEDCMEEEHRNNLETSYAKSYQTKKTISKATLRAMEQSEFNRYFDYVEFDDECDPDLMEDLVREWKAVSDILGLGKSENCSLRFRKLGNHKATGLYYPLHNSICIDVRCPASMMHEYLHMLDYSGGRLSRQKEFESIKHSYKECLGYSAYGNSMLWDRLKGKGKYNFSYYFRATEIFARCGEIYLTRVLHIDNSLVKPEGGFAYPEDPGLMREISRYYEMAFHATKKIVA